ncbi:cyclase family protein [Mangrovihabitans endophyticus]|uniref:Cyclase n=1 Tax=Mangrovihabitans endophyticus TaxID=1751298 RepID=A0A8J3FST3_9ACTN|nr:cyclase family protein [Mangrovihabitans endophyticus]GGL19336.1 cyclase [Mangrovihabitans endophyticus]
MRLDRLGLVSLSHVNDPATAAIFPGDPPLTLDTVATIERDGYYLRAIRAGEHTGTHWGAPGHFTDGAALADDLDVRDLFRPAVKIDVRDRCAADADYRVGVADLMDWERRHGRIPDESVVVLWTGWDRRWGTGAFANLDADGVPHQPGFALEAVQWLVDTGRIGHRGGTGTDTFGPDPGTDATYAVSRLVYRRHRISLEVLANLAALPATGAYVLCGGAINRAGSGSTALIYGLIPPPPGDG